MTTNPSSLSAVTRITADNANKVLKQLLSIDDTHVDLSMIEHCDSAGIAVLIETKVQCQKQQRVICYHQPQQQLRDLAGFLKVADLLFDEKNGENIE